MHAKRGHVGFCIYIYLYMCIYICIDVIHIYMCIHRAIESLGVDETVGDDPSTMQEFLNHSCPFVMTTGRSLFCLNPYSHCRSSTQKAQERVDSRVSSASSLMCIMCGCAGFLSGLPSGCLEWNASKCLELHRHVLSVRRLVGLGSLLHCLS